jgi:hypothetical protein
VYGQNFKIGFGKFGKSKILIWRKLKKTARIKPTALKISFETTSKSTL